MKQHLVNNLDIRRRGILTAGLVTLGLGAMPALAPAAQPAAPADGVDPLDAVDPAVPRGFKKGAQIDARYPISYQRSVPAACRVMTQHFDAIARRDYSSLAKSVHFPFAIIERLDTVVVNSAEELTNAKAPPSLNFSPNGQLNTDHFSRMKPGNYDMLISLEVINFDPAHVNMAMTFDRYNKHGIRTLRCEGVYCVTNNDGKWAIQLMSTIWTPDDLVGIVYEDAKEAAIRLRANHLVSYIDDTDIIDRPRPHRGLRAGISGGGIGNLFESQQGDDPIAQFKVKGVKSRLSVGGGGPGGAGRGGAGRGGGDANGARTANPNALDPADRRVDRQPHVPKWKSILDDYNKLNNDFYEGAIGKETRIIHHVADKVHRYSGAARYTTSGERISISMEVAVIVLGSGTDWVGNGTLRYVTTHDRNNDDWS